MFKILSIDDSKVVHAILEDSLKGLNCEIVHAYNGKEALSILSQRQDFTVVLLDWEMPVMDGPSTLKELMLAHNNIPVIMLTSKVDADGIARVLSLGAWDYIVKPFTKELLLQKLNALAKQQGAKELSAS